MLRRRLSWALATLSIVVGLGFAVGEARRQMPDGVPPKGSAPVEVTNVRVVDGDSIDAYVDGKRTAIGIIGIDAPSGNTPCGKQATGMLWGLVKGGLRLEDDPDETLDSRDRRMYRAKKGDGSFIDEALVQAGVARITGKGARRAELATVEADARGEQRGCAWGGAPAAPAGQDKPAASSQSPVASALNLLDLFNVGNIAQPPIASAAPMAAPSYPGGFVQDNVISTGLTQPTNLEFVPDGRMFIAQQNGVIRVFKNGALLPTPLIDLQSKVNDYWDHGLLGMALDPEFDENGHLYLLYTLETNANNYEGKKVGRVARYTVVGDTANPNTEQIILGSQSSANDGCEQMPVTNDCIPSEGLSHSVGALKFADDGSLFLTTGDAASFNNVDPLALRAQDINSLGGKVLRINVNGQGYADNPHYNGSLTANRAKVWARGVRNAYRFNIKPGTRIPYLGDVGWNSQEEVSAATAGANLGWPCYEGDIQQAGYAGYSQCVSLYNAGPNAHQEPIIDWSHNFGGTCCGAAATGGAFLQGTAYPAQYQDAYFYADFAKGFLRYLRTDDNEVLVPGSDTAFATDLDGPVDIELGPDQNLYYIAINTGDVRRIRYTGSGNRPPVAQLSATPDNGLLPLSVQFSSSGTLDQDADPLTFNWNFGDGTPSSNQPNPQHTYTTNGTYTVTLTVSDSKPGGTDTATTTIAAGNRRPTATITAPSSSLTYKVGDVIQLTGQATDPDQGTLPGSALSWQVNAQHCPGGACHTHINIVTGGTGNTHQITVPDHGDENHFDIVLTATDAGGLTDVKTVTLFPQTVQVNIASSPTGRQIVYDGTSGTTPFTKTTVPGSIHTLTAPNQTGYAFSSWSDGGAQQHNVTIGTTTATYTATFTPIPTVTFDDKSGQDQPLNGQYPSGVIDWGTNKWYHAAPWESMTTKSASFLGSGQTNATFTFITPRKLLSVRAYNGGFSSTTVSLACTGLPTKTQSIASKQLVTVETGWTSGCSTVTVSSSNGWDTNFDDFVHDQAGADTTAPTISGVQATGVTSTAATISWTTNEASDTQVEYGTTTAYGSSTTLNPAQVTTHSQGLSGLTPGTIYHYRVKSRDGAGNLATSTDFQFTTAPADTTAPLISAVQATNVTANGATIGWTTNEASDTQVEYGTTTAYGTSTTLNTALVTSHSQGLSGLAPSTLYHYRVKSRDGAGNLATSADFTFTTLAADTTAPVISAVQATNVTANGATIGWTTNEGSDTQVEYGTTTAYGTSTTLIPALVTTHSQGLSGLSANTLYHYRVKSRDAAGNLATSGDFTFTTSAAPATQTVTFNDKAGQDQPLSGEYPTGVINWGPDGWYHSGPWGAFTTKSASFGGPGQTNATFTFVSPRKLVSVRVYNGGGSNTTVTFTCGSQTKSQVVAPGANVVVTTGWANACTSVTFASTNGWDTNFDDIVHGAP